MEEVMVTGTLKDEVEQLFAANNCEFNYNPPLYFVRGTHEDLLTVTQKLQSELDFTCDNGIVGKGWEIENKILDHLMVFVDGNDNNRGFLAMTKTVTQDMVSAGKQLTDVAMARVLPFGL